VKLPARAALLPLLSRQSAGLAVSFASFAAIPARRPLTLIADDGAGRAIKTGKDGKPLPPQDPVDRGSGHPELVGDAVGTSAQLTGQRADRLHDRFAERVLEPSRTARAVPQTFNALLAVALPPLRDCAAGDALRLGDLRLGPAFLQTADEQQPTVLVELRVSMGHRGASVVLC
jgi:hypothetical protein